VDARSAADDRPALVVLASRLGELGTPPVRPPAGGLSLRQARDDWLSRLEASQKSESAIAAYRVAIHDLLAWSEAHGRNVLEEATIVDYLRSYQQRARPAPATYYRRFLLLRRFLRWVSRRDGAPDPFVDLDPPPKPRQERDWLTPEEFRLLHDAAGRPERNLPGLAERDRLALLALVTTAFVAPSCVRSSGGTSSSAGVSGRCSSATGRAASLDVNRCRLASPMSC
jgi:integrase